MKEVHLTNPSIPGVRCLREMKASTNKIRRDAIYASKIIVPTGTRKHPLAPRISRRRVSKGDRKVMPVRTAEETRHSITSSLEGKSKNHPIQCIPPNTTPTTEIMKIYANALNSTIELKE
jgi:hypothetical protein